MTINIPPEIENSILAAVRSGRFRSVDEAVTAAWLEWDRRQPTSPQPPAGEHDLGPDPIMGLWRDCADEIDEIVADAYRRRSRPSWRELDLE
ncbi:hypothetical protein [Aquisphaera insulae]|uniref:hypothetical protein n=1 Tax=Aquisphaera insulae TaxID=2712864 RepID=UPI0013EE0DAF|nr:hypothetical protein [Aquisphaera insulae]